MQHQPSETFGQHYALPPSESYCCAMGCLLAWFYSYMFFTLLLFFASAGAIYFACEYFVNGIEWFGRRLHLGATAIGSVLAAFGTALPESAVTFIAVVCGNTPEQKEIGVGAAMGGPLVLATLGYAAVGLAFIFNRQYLKRDTYQVNTDHERMSRDQLDFLAIFIVKVSLGLFIFAFKPWLGLFFLALYARYVWKEIHGANTAAEEEHLEPLKICPSATTPSLGCSGLQSLLALLVIGFASHVFVSQLESIGAFLQWPSYLVALLLSPIATELPEIMNVLIWVRQGKERLALANISGAMMIQATIPSALGIFFTPWHFDTPLLLSGMITALAIMYLWFIFRRGIVDSRLLLVASLMYVIFAGLISLYFQ